MQWARRLRFTMAVIYGITGYFLAVLITNFPIPTVTAIVAITALVSGITAARHNDGRMPNA